MNQELKDTLNLFKRQVDKLRSNKDFFKNLKLVIEGNQKEGAVVEFIKRPDEKSVKSFLIDFRPFYLQSESINFYKICNLLYRNLINKQLKEEIKWAREAWNNLLERKGKGKAGHIRLKLGSKDILSEENLNNWMYGEYFHINKNKRKVLEKIEPMQGLSLLLLFDLLQRLSLILFYLETHVIDKVLKDN